MGISFPLSFAPRSPPVTAMILSEVKVNIGPMSVTSRTASFSSFPTRILAFLKDRVSMTPAAGTPNSWYPVRPMSWIVVINPPFANLMPMSYTSFAYFTYWYVLSATCFSISLYSFSVTERNLIY